MAALLMAVPLTGMLSCIDDKYRIDEIDKEVHFAPGGASFPLGYIEKKTLGDIIGENVSTIGVHDDGYYVLRHEGKIGYTIDNINVGDFVFSNLKGFFGQDITVNPKGDGSQLPETIEIEQQYLIMSIDDTEIPSFDMSGDKTSIELLNLTGTGNIPDGLSGTVEADKTFSGTISSGNNAKITIDVTLPDQVNSVQTVWLKDENGTPSQEKTTVKLALNMGGLTNITKSLKVNAFTVTLPPNYQIQPGAYATPSIPLTNTFTATNIDLGPGPYELEFYITEIDMSGITPSGGKLYQEEDFSYTIDYTLTTKEATVGSELPKAEITGAPAFRDAQFTTNEIEFKLENPYTYRFSQAIAVGDVVESASYVAFKGNKTLILKIGELGLLNGFRNELPIEITFPESFVFDPELTDNTLSAPASAFLGDGYDLVLCGIKFTGDERVPDEGKLTLAGDIAVKVKKTTGGSSLRWLEDVEGKSIPDPINIEIAPAILTLDYVNSEYTLNAVSQEVSAKKENLGGSFELPSVIKGLSQVLIAKAVEETDAAVEMTLSVEISKWFDRINKFYLDDFKVKLPSFLIIDASALGDDFDAETNIYSPGRITVEKPDPESVTTEFDLVSFKVKGLSGITVTDGVAAIKGDLEFSATACTPGGITISPEDEMTIKPKLEISDISITGLDGLFDLTLEDYIDDDDIEPIDFSELFEYLSENENQQPNLAAPVLTLDIENPLGINFLGNITLDPKNAEGESLCAPITLAQNNRFKIGPSCTTYVYISDNGVANAPEADGYVGYNLKLSDLVNVIPHTVDIGVSGKVNPDQNLINSVLLSNDDYQFSLGYTIEVPLAFGPEMEMELKFDVDDLNDTFSDLAEQKVKAADIAVYAGFTVSFPLKIENVKVEFTDSQGGPIDGLVPTVSGSICGPAKAGDKPQESVLAIGLTVPNGGDFTTLKDIDIMKITIPISSANRSENAQNQLSPNDTIEGRVWIELAKGVSVNLGDLD